MAPASSDVPTAHMNNVYPPTPPDSDDNDTVSIKANEPQASASFPLPPVRTPAAEVLDVDKSTPDNHVPRDPRLIRLTGVHPFNVEPPLTELWNEGFLTSQNLFYVRNHGAVPEVCDKDVLDWEFSVEGLVSNPFRMTLRDLLSEYEQVTYPVTLVCAGNRRKEQNVVRKTKGFSWGAAGVSTALFTGVPMAEVVRRARPKRQGRFVCMEGADKLPNGFYGTSVKMNWVMDPNRGIMLAHGMNGEMLEPDHGKPLRAVIPGQIGGRSVKWLRKLIVTAEPSDNWYHIYDNRVLPTQVSPTESANNPKWWMDDRYAIYDLSCNSAIAQPAHEERLCLADAAQTYQLTGYAYSGGGKRITRVEISSDRGKTWNLATVNYPEDAYREALDDPEVCGGRLDMSWREASFCWCFWAYDIGVEELASSKDILVRCMDESMQIQPRDMYWSVLGMMNNPWFRITISREGDYLRFEHPTQPALMPGGWMERVKKAGGNLTNGVWGEKSGTGGEKENVESPSEQADQVKLTKEGVDRLIEMDELREHEGKEKPWFVLDGEVFDGAPFMDEHPGGAQSIISAAGMDTTDEFMAIHSETAKAMMPSYHVGRLTPSAITALKEGPTQSNDNNNTTTPRPTFLDPRNWSKATLTSKRTVSWDTRIFRFKMQHASQTLGLPTGQHLMMRLRDPATREAIIRSYTPLSQVTQQEHVDILVKIYFDTTERKGGKMSQALDALPVGHFVEFKGPIGKFEYLGAGRCSVNGRERRVGRFVMICGGSGVTPIFQVFRAVMQDRDDGTRCVVLNGNRLVEDILCREEIERYRRGNEHKCRVVHTLTQPPEGWEGLKGRIGVGLLEEYASVCGEGDSMVLICGPEGLEKAVKGGLLGLGWREEDMLFF